MVAPAVAAAGITAGASLLSGAFSGGLRSSGGGYPRAYGMAERYTGYKARVRQAKEAGLHPLFAMGTSSTAGPGFAIPGQSRSGSYARKAIEDAGKLGVEIYKDKANLVTAQAALAAVELARHSIGNDTAQRITLPSYQPDTQSVKKGQVDPFRTKNPEQSLNVKSPMTQVRIGSQKVWVPVEEIDEFMENPLAVGGLTYIYHGNKNVDWKRMANDYAGKNKSPSWKRAWINKISRFIHGSKKTYKKYTTKPKGRR